MLSWIKNETVVSGCIYGWINKWMNVKILLRFADRYSGIELNVSLNSNRLISINRCGSSTQLKKIQTSLIFLSRLHGIVCKILKLQYIFLSVLTVAYVGIVCSGLVVLFI
jgi:hypothetical protein